MKKNIVLQVIPTVLGAFLLSHVGVASATPANTFADYHFEVDFESFDHEDPQVVEIFDNAFSPEVGYEFGPLTVLDPEQGILVFNHCGLGGFCDWLLAQNGTIFDEADLPLLPAGGTRYVYLGYNAGIGFHPNARFWLDKPYAAVGLLGSCGAGFGNATGINTLEVFDSGGNLLEVQERACAHVQDFAARSELAIIGIARPEGIREFTIEGDGWVGAAVLLRELRVCGDGIVDSTEECDDGNTMGGDGCSPTCTIETAWSCTHAAPDAASSCEDGCLNAGKATVTLKTNTTAKGAVKDKAVIKLVQGGVEAVQLGDFTVGDALTIEVRDAAAGAVLARTVAGSAVLWQAKGSGQIFRDKANSNGSGFTAAAAAPESTPGRGNGKVLAKGAGADLGLGNLAAATGPLQVRVSSTAGACLKAELTEIKAKATAGGHAVKAKSAK